MPKILLGFTVGNGEPFYIPRAHTVITGMTALSGKTTTVEAILHRSKAKALVFLTKRGEKTFAEGTRITPYYREQFDWEYVRGLLEAAWKERMRFETPWIIRICKGATSLVMVRERLGRMLTAEKLRDFDRNIYTTLAAYMDKVLPVLEEAKTKFTDKLILNEGINVMDLTEWYTNEEVQMLIIRSCMEHILKKENNVTVALPESWKMLPQQRNTPVKLYFEKFIREGATNGNYLIIDAQDLGGVDKTPLRQVSVWIMGKMMEANEVERLIKQTLGLDVPASEIQTLPLGHFVVATGDEVAKVYAWPHGVSEDLSISVAKGIVKPEIVKELLVAKQAPKLNETLDTAYIRDLEKRMEALSLLVTRNEKRHDEETQIQKQEISEVKQRLDTMQIILEKTIPALQTLPKNAETLQDTLHLIQLKKSVKIEPQELHYKMTTETAAGKVMWLAKEGFLNSWRSNTEVEKQLAIAHGWTMPRITVYKALSQLVKSGYLGMRKTDRAQYKLAEFVTIE